MLLRLFFMVITMLGWLCGNTQKLSNISQRIDSVLAAPSNNPFNGIVYIAQDNKVLYKKMLGYANIEDKTVLQENNEFVIGSISKQFTAMLVLQAYDKKRIDLYIPIKKYLQNLTQPWADTVTIHHLLTHTHGIEHIDKPALFAVGTQYAYSQIGFQLIADILEVVYQKPFATLAQNLFARCNMLQTFHPNVKQYKQLVKGYTKNDSGTIIQELKSLQNYPAAGAFISTVADLHRWNSLVFNGALIHGKTYRRFTTQHINAVRQHPLFGLTKYGYGITVTYTDGIIQFGQTGYAPGFVSLSFYYPKHKISVIVLSNVVYNENDINENFTYHLAIYNLVRGWLQPKK
jgi:D-alanyl-D-alanine carboxypeptidase